MRLRSFHLYGLRRRFSNSPQHLHGKKGACKICRPSYAEAAAKFTTIGAQQHHHIMPAPDEAAYRINVNIVPS
jgi:hypothetical protein